jgi:hypothetical protein
VASGTIVATIIAGLIAGRNIWISTALALCNTGEALLVAWLIERYFGSGFSLNRLRNVLGSAGRCSRHKCRRRSRRNDGLQSCSKA